MRPRPRRKRAAVPPFLPKLALFPKNWAFIFRCGYSLVSFLTLCAFPVQAGIFPDNPFSDNAAGSTGASFLKVPLGARTQGMGEAYTALSGDGHALFWNPAGLAELRKQKRRTIHSGYARLLDEVAVGYMGATFPAMRGTLGAGLVYTSHGSMQQYNVLGDALGSFTPLDLAASLAYAQSWEGVAAGFSLKAIHASLSDGISGNTVAVDVGVLWPSALQINEEPVDLGLLVQNFGFPININGQKDSLPFQASMGLAWHPHNRATLGVDARLPVDQNPYVVVGLELRYPLGPYGMVALRGGYNRNHSRGVGGLAGLTAGGGFIAGGLSVDYAWVTFGDVGHTHRFSLGWSWGGNQIFSKNPTKKKVF